MRETRTAQTSIFQIMTDHEIAYELRAMSDWLDAHPSLLDLVAMDIRNREGRKQGRSGLSIDSILRCAILKQYRQVDYRTLAFYLRDSVSFREFARLTDITPPGKSTLQRLVSSITESTWEAMGGERVPSAEKLVSLFEPHTDMIVKGQREVQYGHKLTLSSGISNLVLDVVIEDGNPSDSVCLEPMIKRHTAHYGQPPKQLAADGGYASRANLGAAKGMGVEQVAFHKRVGLSVEEMTGDRWLYNKLRHFRAGIESVISYLRRCFGLSRCNWKGLAHFKAYVRSAVFTHNLLVLTRRLAAP